MTVRTRRRRMRDEEWEDMREEIDDILSDNKPAPTRPAPIKRRKKETTPGYLIALVFLGVLLACAIYLTWMKRSDMQIPISMPTQEAQSDWQPSEGHVQNELDEVYAQLEKLTSDNEEIYRRVSLLGSVCNNNFYVVRNKKPVSDMVAVKRDWRLDKVPPHLHISEPEEYKERY